MIRFLTACAVAILLASMGGVVFYASYRIGKSEAVPDNRTVAIVTYECRQDKDGVNVYCVETRREKYGQ